MTLSRSAVWLVVACMALAGCYRAGLTEPGEDLSVALPAPMLDPPTGATTQVVILAGGCFWGVEAVFEHVKGVTSAVSGYSGGSVVNPTYNNVMTGLTGHAESVQVTYDPSKITYGQILRIFFSVAHDPTQLNAQFPDEGPQYRSDIFYRDEAQRAVARAYIDQLDAAHAFASPIATRIDPLDGFYPAESKYQDYLAHHEDEGYIRAYDLPKLTGLKRLFPALYRDP